MVKRCPIRSSYFGSREKIGVGTRNSWPQGHDTKRQLVDNNAKNCSQRTSTSRQSQKKEINSVALENFLSFGYEKSLKNKNCRLEYEKIAWKSENERCFVESSAARFGQNKQISPLDKQK